MTTTTVPLPELMVIQPATGHPVAVALAVALVIEWFDPSVDPGVFAISTGGASYRIATNEFRLYSPTRGA